MRASIVLLPGDGIGPEVVFATRRVLEAVAAKFDHRLQMKEHLIGGIAIDSCGNPLPNETLQACQEADAILLGAVGGVQWDDIRASVRPEQGLLGIRKALGLFGNLRPVTIYPNLKGASPLKPEQLEGVDLVVVRELTGGIYFGQPSLRQMVDGVNGVEEQAVDTMSYTVSEVERVARLAFELALERRRKVTSVDKANVLECSRLWRQVVSQISIEYPKVTLEHSLVDAAAMFLITRPASFDVILTENMFGDILTDEASVLSGSMGNLPSASLGESLNTLGKSRGLYEPIHGSAPDIAGKGIANPTGTVLSAALLLRYSLGLKREAELLELAVQKTISSSCLTTDLGGNKTTQEFTNVIIEHLIELTVSK